jgi:hypothetical protein
MNTVAKIWLYSASTVGVTSSICNYFHMFTHEWKTATAKPTIQHGLPRTTTEVFDGVRDTLTQVISPSEPKLTHTSIMVNTAINILMTPALPYSIYCNPGKAMEIIDHRKINTCGGSGGVYNLYGDQSIIVKYNE